MAVKFTAITHDQNLEKVLGYLFTEFPKMSRLNRLSLVRSTLTWLEGEERCHDSALGVETTFQFVDKCERPQESPNTFAQHAQDRGHAPCPGKSE